MNIGIAGHPSRHLGIGSICVIDTKDELQAPTSER